MKRGIVILPLILSACGKPDWQTAIEHKLIDPTSAQYRNVNKRDDIVCGEVNAKNRMGGYAGFVRFFVDGSTAEIEPRELIAGDEVARLNAATDAAIFSTAHIARCAGLQAQ